MKTIDLKIVIGDVEVDEETYSFDILYSVSLNGGKPVEYIYNNDYDTDVGLIRSVDFTEDILIDYIQNHYA